MPWWCVPSRAQPFVVWPGVLQRRLSLAAQAVSFVEFECNIAPSARKAVSSRLVVFGPSTLLFSDRVLESLLVSNGCCGACVPGRELGLLWCGLVLQRRLSLAAQAVSFVEFECNIAPSARKAVSSSSSLSHCSSCDWKLARPSFGLVAG
jgi:hypothetical protein